VNKVITKADIRAHLEQEMDRFLSRGGHVDKIPRGISGRESGAPLVPPARGLFIEPSSERTPVPEVIAAIEARRKQKLKRTPPPKQNRAPKRRRKMIYDDFGEPLRQVWVEE
jgi:hypothetical protein